MKIKAFSNEEGEASTITSFIRRLLKDIRRMLRNRDVLGISPVMLLPMTVMMTTLQRHKDGGSHEPTRYSGMSPPSTSKNKHADKRKEDCRYNVADYIGLGLRDRVDIFTGDWNLAKEFLAECVGNTVAVSDS